MADGSLAHQILAAAAAEPPKAATALKALAPVVRPLTYVLGFTCDHVVPLYLSAFRFGFRVYESLPVDLFSALVGLGLSFCGGPYCASIAAIQAFRMCGWETTRQALLDIASDARAVYAAHAADEQRSADVSELDVQELLSRKLAIYAMAVKDPDRLSAAVGGLYTAWLAVQGVLRLEFAKTITLGVSIAEMATPVLNRLGVPVLVHVVPQPYHHWIPMMIKSTARAIGVAFAWRLQVVVSAVHLAMCGGLLFARSLLRWAQKRRLLSTREEDTYADELLGYSVAALGFYVQLSCGFETPFPLSLVMMPFNGVEWYIRYSITASSAPAAA